MKPNEREAGEAELVFEYALDAAPETVWKALACEELRNRWLPAGDLAEKEPVVEDPGRRISFTMRESEPPHLESVVTFDLQPSQDGCTRLRIVHSIAAGMPVAANGNRPPALMAA